MLEEHPAQENNVFHQEIRNNLPRVLSLIDKDETSQSFGYADRYFWAWGLIDFPNATFQGLANGLARLWVNGLWPYHTPETIYLDRIHSLFIGAQKLTRQDGSLEEAFPNEGSYCVTALVAFDLLVAYDLLQEIVDQNRKDHWLNIIEPLVGYLIKADENHAFVSNHLATASAALFRWNLVSGGSPKAKEKGELLLQRILDNQSSEGWFIEYQGADPGYQSLCMNYLSDIHLNCVDLGLSDPLRKSVQFLCHFAHPDGSFGGYYGSRSTRFYYPGGLLYLSDSIPEASLLSEFMMKSIIEQKVVGLSCMDEPNLSPMFNSFVWAASIKAGHKSSSPLSEDVVLPCRSRNTFRSNFPHAGMVIDRGDDHYSIISYKMGGVIKHFVNDKLQILDAGALFQSNKGKFGSSQFYQPQQKLEEDRSKMVVRSQVAEMPKTLSTPFRFLVLRMLCITVFRFPAFREWTKRILVRRLITKPKLWPICNSREITFGKNLHFVDKHQVPQGYKRCSVNAPFVSFHMASKGYWQMNDEFSKNDP